MTGFRPPSSNSPFNDPPSRSRRREIGVASAAVVGTLGGCSTLSPAASAPVSGGDDRPLVVTRPVGAILGFRLPILAEIAVVWLTFQAAIAGAVALLVARADDESVSVRGVASLVVFQCCLFTAVWAAGATGTILGFFAMLAGILLFAFVTARLFAAPVLLVRGESILGAVRRSSDAIAGHTLSVVVFSTVIGTLQYWLGSVPMLDWFAEYGGFELHVALGTILGVTVCGPLGVLAAMRIVAIAADE